jgi:hypothetical protein
MQLSMVQFSLEDFKKIVQQVVKEELSELSNKISEEEFLTRKEAAKFLCIGLTTLDKLKNEKRLSPMKEGRNSYYLKSQLVEYRKSLLTKGYGQDV